jgi:hypothetical protein
MQTEIPHTKERQLNLAKTSLIIHKRAIEMLKYSIDWHKKEIERLEKEIAEG